MKVLLTNVFLLSTKMLGNGLVNRVPYSFKAFSFDWGSHVITLKKSRLNLLKVFVLFVGHLIFSTDKMKSFLFA